MNNNEMFYRIPWFIYIGLAVGAMLFGFLAHQNENKLNAARVIAQQSPIPALIDAGEVTSSSFTDAKEINVAAQVALDDVYDVSFRREPTNRYTEKTAIFGLPVGAVDKSKSTNVIFVLDKDANIEAFVSKFTTSRNGTISLILNVNGESYLAGNTFADIIEDAAAKAGIHLGGDVQFVEPFMISRQEGLKPTSGYVSLMWMGFVAAFFIAAGVFRYMYDHKKWDE